MQHEALVGAAPGRVPPVVRRAARGSGEAVDSRAVVRQLARALPMPIVILLGEALGVPMLTLAGVLGTLAIAVLSPMSGLVSIAFLAPFKPLLVLPAPGFTVFLVAAVLAGYVFSLPVSRPRLSFGPIVLLVLGLGLYAFVQQLPAMTAGYSTGEGHSIGFKFFQYSAAIGTVFAVALVLRGRDPRAVLAALLASAVGVALLAVATLVDPSPTGPLTGLIPTPDDGARATGSFGNPNYYGFFIASATILALALYRVTVGRGARIVLASVVALLVIALMLSLSRGAVTAVAAGVLTLAFLRSPRTGFVVVGLFLVTALVLYPAFVEFRLLVLTGSADGAATGAMASSDAGRLDAVLSGPILWLTSPIFGVGFGRYLFEYAAVLGGDGSVAHNWYMTVLAEQGVVGITLWALLLIATFFHLRTRPQVPRTVGLAVLATTVAGFMFLQPPTAFQTAALPAIAITAALVARWPDVDRERRPETRRRERLGKAIPRVRAPRQSRIQG